MTQSQHLGRPIALVEGGCISTVEEALHFYFSLPMRERIELHWTEAARLFVATFEESGGVILERAETQFRLALIHRY
jgi:hypothetical protein